MPITPKRLKETLNFDVATKISNSDYQSFLAFCRKKRKTRAALARIAIRFFIVKPKQRRQNVKTPLLRIGTGGLLSLVD